MTKSIARAQKQVEAQNFSVRKHLLEYDDVMNKQRENVYGLRRQLLEGQIVFEDDPEPVDIRAYLMTIGENVLDSLIDQYCGGDVDPNDWDLAALKDAAAQTFNLDATELEVLDEPDQSQVEIREALWDLIQRKYTAKEAAVGRELLDIPESVQTQIVAPERFAEIGAAPYEQRSEVAGRAVVEPIARSIMLQIVDAQWKDHLYSLDHLKEGIGLRGYGQRDPLVEYKKECFALFQGMKDRIDDEMLRYLWRLRPVINERADGAGPRRPARGAGRDGSPAAAASRAASAIADVQRYEGGAVTVRRRRRPPPRRHPADRPARLARRVLAATTRRFARCATTHRKWAATIPARAAAARNTRNATVSRRDPSHLPAGCHPFQADFCRPVVYVLGKIHGRKD